MTRSHAGVLTLASLTLAGYLAVWLWVLPDRTLRTFRTTDYIYLNLGVSLIGAVGLDAAVLVPVVLHPLGSRWLFRVFVALSVVFAFLNVGPVVKGFIEAREASALASRLASHDMVWVLLTQVGLLLLYLLAGVCFLSWAVWQWVRALRSAEPGRHIPGQGPQ
jgi:hypothetical protein